MTTDGTEQVDQVVGLLERLRSTQLSICEAAIGGRFGQVVELSGQCTQLYEALEERKEAVRSLYEPGTAEAPGSTTVNAQAVQRQRIRLLARECRHLGQFCDETLSRAGQCVQQLVELRQGKPLSYGDSANLRHPRRQQSLLRV